MSPESEARYWPKVVAGNNGCWIWVGWRWNGYGRFRIDGKGVPAHRVSYEHFHGPIAPGLQVDHLCRVRHCVNPTHLEPVTLVENVMRGESPHARNARRTHCIHGHEFTPANTGRLRRPGRFCRECKRVWNSKRDRRTVRAAGGDA